MLITMCSAIFFRITPIFSMRTLSPGWNAGGGGAIGARATEAAGAGAAASVARAPMAPPPPAFQPGESVRIEKMGVMRKKIAEHMVMSIHTSPHVYSAYEVDFSRIDALRQKKKADYEAAGTKLTYTAFIAKATVDTIR